jgi:hypothetical protein
MADIEIIYDGNAIGQFLSGPDKAMIIQYMPYRSLSHYEFGQALHNKLRVTIAIGKETFTALEIVKPHHLLVSR